MPKYLVYAKVVGSKFIGTFEADTSEKAIKLAENSDEAYVSLCHQCSSKCEDPECYDFVAEEDKN